MSTEIKIFNSNGKLLHTQNIQNFSSKLIQLNLNTSQGYFVSGQYLIQLKYDGKVYTQNFVLN